MKSVLNDDTHSSKELYEVIFAIIRDRKIAAPADASAMADQLVCGLREAYGPGDVYVPGINRKERNRSIVREYKGCNVTDLARKHGLSERHIMRIISEGSLHG